jgi:hypothetical protein
MSPDGTLNEPSRVCRPTRSGAATARAAGPLRDQERRADCARKCGPPHPRSRMGGLGTLGGDPRGTGITDAVAPDGLTPQAWPIPRSGPPQSWGGPARGEKMHRPHPSAHLTIRRRAHDRDRAEGPHHPGTDTAGPQLTRNRDRGIDRQRLRSRPRGANPSREDVWRSSRRSPGSPSMRTPGTADDPVWRTQA